MGDYQSILFAGGGFVAGAFVAWAFLRGRLMAQTAMVDAFKALASDSLNRNNEAFLHLAESRFKQSEQQASSVFAQKTTAIDELVRPMKESLQKMDAQIQALEIKREGAYREIAEMVSASRESQNQLRGETSQLLQALRSSTGRGRWGEVQLQRILEMTGMSEHVGDFQTQATLSDEEGKIRPDMIVNLPGRRCIIIDSKVPLTGFLDATQATEEMVRLAALKQHSRQLKDHIKTLGGKAYWEKVEGAPEFVVLFLPGEHFLSAALDVDPSLMEYSANQKVILATPMTLMALLRTVAFGWRQEALRDNVRQVADLGGKLYSSLVVFSKHMGAIGGKISGTVESYNKAVQTLERNVFSKARQFNGLGVASAEEEIETLEYVDREPRVVVSLDEAQIIEDRQKKSALNQTK